MYKMAFSLTDLDLVRRRWRYARDCEIWGTENGHGNIDREYDLVMFRRTPNDNDWEMTITDCGDPENIFLKRVLARLKGRKLVEIPCKATMSEVFKVRTQSGYNLRRRCSNNRKSKLISIRRYD